MIKVKDDSYVFIQLELQDLKKKYVSPLSPDTDTFSASLEGIELTHTCFSTRRVLNYIFNFIFVSRVIKISVEG